MRTQTRFLIFLAVLAIGGTVLLAQRSEGRHRATGEPLQPDGTTQIESLAGTVDQTAITGNRPISQPVTVTNFPDPQRVAGTVSVDNFPAVQEVTGTVTLANGGQSAPFQLVGFTTAQFHGQGLIAHTLACQAEFQHSRICTTNEIAETVVIPNLPSDPSVWAWVRPVLSGLA